jgi:hypothetical protein
MYSPRGSLASRGMLTRLPSSRTAICRGAVFKGFLDGINGAGRDISNHGIEAPISVTSTISRASYGVVYYETYDSSIHNPNEKAWHEEEQKWIVDDNMRWFIKRVSSHPISI